MALDYTYTKYKDVYTITNNAVIDVTYTLSEVTCDASTEILTGVIAPDTTKEIPINFDGNYTILLDDGDEQETIEIKDYNELLKSFINSVESILCGCKKCDTCDECNECDEYLASLIKGMAFSTLNIIDYQVVVNAVMVQTNCEFTADVRCNMLQEQIYGSADNIEILKKILAVYYIGFYYTDFEAAIDAEEEEYISIKYKYAKISKCVKNLGLDIEQIQESLQPIQLCKSWIWDFDSIVDNTTIMRINYVDCLGVAQEILDLRGNLESPIIVCSDGTQPIIVVGTLTSFEEC